jgi:hypothetical protein
MMMAVVIIMIVVMIFGTRYRQHLNCSNNNILVFRSGPTEW